MVIHKEAHCVLLFWLLSSEHREGSKCYSLNCLPLSLKLSRHDAYLKFTVLDISTWHLTYSLAGRLKMQILFSSSSC